MMFRRKEKELAALREDFARRAAEVGELRDQLRELDERLS